MSKPNVTRVQSATQSTASVHTLHMPKPNVTRVQSATQSTASVHTLHMPKPNVTHVQSATQSTASVHTLQMPKPNVTRVQSATQSTASVHTLHMPKPNATRVQGAIKWAVLPKIFLTWTQMKNGCGSSVCENIAGVWQKRHCVSFPMGEASMSARVYNQSARCYWEVLRTSPVYLSSCFLKQLDAILVKDGREVKNIKILSHLVGFTSLPTLS